MKRLFLMLVLLITLQVQAQDDELPYTRLLDVHMTYHEGQMVIQASYTMDYDLEDFNFSWLIPVPIGETDITVETAEGDWFPTITHDTYGFEFNNIRIFEPRRYCNIVYPGFVSQIDGIGDGTHYDEITFSEYAILTADEVLEWVAQHGKTVMDAETLLENYPEHVFVALYFESEYEAGTIVPISITYSDFLVTVPMRSLNSVNVDVWIYGRERYVPDNFPARQIDFSQLRNRSLIGDPYYFYPYGDSERHNYDTLRFEASKGGFITEYAAQFGNNRFLTKLYGKFLEPPLQDPFFIPMPGLPEVSDSIAVGYYVDPIVYWGCSTRRFIEELQTDILDSTRVFDVNAAYPPGWVRSEVEIGEQSMTIFAPNPVTLEDYEAYGRGEETDPMLVYVRTEKREDGYSLSGISRIPEQMIFSQSRFLPYASGMILGAVLTTDEDWEANRELYHKVLEYLHALPYYTHDELLYTLFLDNLMIGYPQGWLERSENDIAEIWITPADNEAVGVHIRAGDDLIGNEVSEEGRFIRIIDTLSTTYQLGDSLIASFAENTGCSDLIAPVMFEVDGRKGWLYLVIDANAYVIEISAPVEVFEDYRAELERIGENMRYNRACG